MFDQLKIKLFTMAGNYQAFQEIKFQHGYLNEFDNKKSALGADLVMDSPEESLGATICGPGDDRVSRQGGAGRPPPFR